MKLKLTLAVLLCAVIPFFLQAEDVQVTDIGSDVILIGKLGKPLGTMADVEGQMISEPKQGKSGQFTAAFRVSKVDGTALKKAQTVGLVFRASEGMPSIHARDLVQLTGYESGAFVGTPDAARAVLGRDASPFDWKFESMVYVIKAQPSSSP